MASGIIKKMNDKVLDLYASIGDIIYHYTSPSGLKGIIDVDPSLFFTRYDCLNDFSEGKIIEPLYKSVLDDYHNKHVGTREFCRLIRDVEPSNTLYLPIEGNRPKTNENDNSYSY